MNTTNIFQDMSDTSRIWIYGFSSILSAEQKTKVSQALDTFVLSWQSHGNKVKGGYVLPDDCFAILASDDPEGISGCSIDSSVQVFKGLKLSHGIDALNRNLIYYRDGDTINITERSQFNNLAENGVVTGDTIVFNTVLQTVKDLRQNKFETRLQDSWHAKAFTVKS